MVVSLGQYAVTATSDLHENTTLEDKERIQDPGNVAPGETAQVNTAAVLDTQKYIKGGVATAAHAAFLAEFRQGVQVNLTTRLMFQHGWSGEWLVPTQVCGVYADDGLVFDFYMDSLVHSINCQTGKAFTEISGRYVRPENSFMGVALNGTFNPLYQQ